MMMRLRLACEAARVLVKQLDQHADLIERDETLRDMVLDLEEILLDLRDNEDVC